MHFEGQSIICNKLDGQILELQFNLKGDSVNKFGAATLKELNQVVQEIKADSSIQGLLITSGKEAFVVGADVTEFLSYFDKSETELLSWLKQTNDLFSQIEDLPYPSVVALNGFALGGGFELALSATYRVMSQDAKVGLPETKLGIYPGWGGTVRLSRLTGADNAIEWIASGEQWNAEAALKIGAVDAVVAPDQLKTISLNILKKAMSGALNWKARTQEKKAPLKLNSVEATMVFEGAKAFVAAKAGPNYPAPVAAIEVMQKGATKNRDEAISIESAGFAKVAKTQTAHSLVGLFLGDQYLKKMSKKIAKSAPAVSHSAVLGAGIMGGGIAYTSALKKIPIVMKDINHKALELGMNEAIKHLEKQVSSKKMTSKKMAEVLSGIHSTLSYGDFKTVDFVVEAVIENEKIKKTVLQEVEANVKEGTVITSNTSTISISKLAESLKHPENFCGVHFFNPVHKMPLIEIIRGKKTSETAIATAVSYSVAMGKTPIVVNDCAGFFINRVLFPYFAGFEKLLQDGVDFQKTDRAMEKFGWPMGPAFLLDVVGIDTAHHADEVMAEAYPDRMSHTGRSAIQIMYQNQRYGQKNSKGFFIYSPDKKGPPKKEVDPTSYTLLQECTQTRKYPSQDIADSEIVDRMMLPMLIECSRCLEDGIISTPIEVDIGLIYGLGFPPFRGGVLRYADSVGLKKICESAKKYESLGKLYHPTQQMLKLAESGKTFYEEHK